MEIKLFSQLTDEQVKFIAEKNYNFWKKVNPTLDYALSVGNIMSMKDNVDTLPLGIALLDDSVILGFCTLRLNRLNHHLDINPWLCNVMIFDDYRGKGYAKIMLQYACEKFKTLGYDKVYVWTDQTPEFYKKLGWMYEGIITKNEGGRGYLFSKNITSNFEIE